MNSSRPLPAGLVQERLVAIGHLMRAGRKQVINDVYDPALDYGWGIGCLCFDRIRKRIAVAADGEYSSWLDVISPGLHFVFTADGVPLRYYRGRKDRRAPEGQIALCAAEAHAHQMTVLRDDETSAVYRLMYESDRSTLLLSRLFLVELEREGNVTYAWEVPLHESGGQNVDGQPEDVPVVPIDSAERPVTLPPASVEFIEELIAQEEEEMRQEEQA